MDLNTIVIPVVTKAASGDVSAAKKAPAKEKTTAPATLAPSSKPPPSGQ